MGRKKYDKETSAARKELQSAQAGYKKALSEVKGVFKAFFGKGAAKEAEKVVQQQIMEQNPDISFTKAGLPTIDRKKRSSASFVKGIAKGLDEITTAATDVMNVGVFIMDRMTWAPEKIAKATATQYVNRRIDALRKGFGDDSAYVDLMKEDLKAVGVDTTALGRVKPGATVGNLWKALEAAPKLDKEVAGAIDDMMDIKIPKDEMKEKVKSAKKSPTMMKSIGSYLAAVKSSSGQYSEALKALYAMDPNDITSDAGMDYQDLLDELSHPGQKLTEAEIEENLQKITKYLGGWI